MDEVMSFLKGEMSSKAFLYKAIIVVLGFGLIGFALKFTTYFDNWYWLPVIPNLFDSMFIIIAALMLLYVGLGGKRL